MSSVVVVDSGSDSSSSSSSEESYQEPHNVELSDILKQFFINKKNENIATILTNLTKEIKMLRLKLNVK